MHAEFLRLLDEAARAAVVGDPAGDVLYGPLISERFADGFEKVLGWIGPGHTVHGSSATGRITAAPREGFTGTPRRACTTTR